MVDGRVPVIAERDIAKLQKRRHLHFIANQMNAQSATLTAAEVSYLMTWEWALSAADVVWRRSKLGLRLSAAEIASIDEWIATKAPHESPLLQAGGRT